MPKIQTLPGLLARFNPISFPDPYSLLRMRDEKIGLWKNPIPEARIRLLHHMRSMNVVIKIFNLIGVYVKNMKLKIDPLRSQDWNENSLESFTHGLEDSKGI